MISYPGGVTITQDDAAVVYMPDPPNVPAQLERIEALLTRIAVAVEVANAPTTPFPFHLGGAPMITTEEENEMMTTEEDE